MKFLFTILLLCIAGVSFGQLNIDVASLGAVGNGTTDNTAIIQLAIDSVADNGGGEVIINNGTYLSNTIILKSDVTLRVTTGTTLMAQPNYNDFPDLPYALPSWMDTYTDKSLIFAQNVNNIRITGGGTINGNGNQLGYLSVTKNLRPFGMRLAYIDTLQIDSINLEQAPQWFGNIHDCGNVHIFNIYIYNQGFGSNDGIDIDGSVNVLVENSTFDTDDDCLPIKTEDYTTTRDVTVRNCQMATFERAVKIGNESLGPFVNIHFQDITVVPSTNTILGLSLTPLNAIYVAVADGGSMDSIYIQRVTVNAPTQTSLFVRLCDRGNSFDSTVPTVKYLRNVWFSDITSTQTTTTPSSVTGIPGYPVRNVFFDNVVLTVPGGGPAGDTSLPELTTVRPEVNIWGDTLPAYGLFVWHADSICMDSLCVITQSYDQRPLYYFSDTTEIKITNPCSNADINGINSPAACQMYFYPNPVSDVLNIADIPSACEAFIFYDMRGAIAAIAATRGQKNLIVNLASLEPGVYTVAAMGQNYREIKKVVVAR